MADDTTCKERDGEAVRALAVPCVYQLRRVTNWMTRLVFVPVSPVTS
jgi:hypothetical protein